MSDDGLASLRQRVRNDLGEEFERKASDAFCRDYSPVTMRGSSPTVLEFAAPTEGMAIPDGFVPPADVAPQPPVPPRMRGGPPPSDPLAPATPPTEEQTERIAQARRAGWWALHEVHAALSREGRGPVMRGGRSSPRGIDVQVCWLNNTMRTKAPPRDFAHLAADPAVLQIDASRRLQREPLAHEPGQSGPAPHEKLARALEAMGVTRKSARMATTGRGVPVAVIDSEVWHAHPAFQNRVHRKAKFTEQWNDPGKHGTAVAGVIAARGEHDGVAPDAIIYNYKVLGRLPDQDADDFDLACALQQALVDGARIANVSLGTPTPPYGGSREVRACDRAWELGLTIVKSVGNFGRLGPGSVTCPADARGVITVGATDLDGIAVQEYSSRGPAADGKACPDLVAPGGRRKVDTVYSCLMDGTFGCCGAGTTLAAAHVSGLLALLLEMQPTLTPDQQRDFLISRCTRLPSGDRNVQGFGFVRWI